MDDRLRLDMDETLNRLTKLERRYEAELAQAERIRAEAERNLVAIRRVRELLGEGGPQLPFSEAGSSEAKKIVSDAVRAYGDKSSSENGYVDRINITQAVRDAVQETEGVFEQPDITEMIRNKYPDARVNPAVVVNALTRMVRRGQGVRLVRKGSGSEPNAYIKVSDSEENTMQEDRMSG